MHDGGERFGRVPAEGGGAGGGVDEHQREVEAEREFEAAPRDGEVREAGERVGDEPADRELGAEEGRVAEVEQVGHQAVALGRDSAASEGNRSEEDTSELQSHRYIAY